MFNFMEIGTPIFEFFTIKYEDFKFLDEFACIYMFQPSTQRNENHQHGRGVEKRHRAARPLAQSGGQ
uniref:Uncharacterized protein n=1 Tax=Romanomermis culicivorax TaxID=13658 RepID=A0A915HTB5_ROMCU